MDPLSFSTPSTKKSVDAGLADVSAGIDFTWIYQRDVIDVGAAVKLTGKDADTARPHLTYHWMTYDLATKTWRDITPPTNTSNWATWKDSYGTKWLHLDVLHNNRTIGSHTIAYAYTAGTTRIDGTYAGTRHNTAGVDDVLLGNYSQNAARVVTKIYNWDTKQWVAQFEGAWNVRNPSRGTYWTHYEAYTTDGHLADVKTYSFRMD